MIRLDTQLIGIRIMHRRKKRGMNQFELAEKIGVSKNHLSNIERGCCLPTLKVLVSICNILGETPDYYILGSFSPNESQLSSLIKQLPEEKQNILQKLIEAYLVSSRTDDGEEKV